MEHHSWCDPNKKIISEQFKKNQETFRNTMERIFQKYSNLDDPGPDVCLATMTFTSEKGSVPLNSNTAEKELRHLRNQLKERSLQALGSPQEEHTLLDQDMDAAMVDLDHSRQMKNSNYSLWCGSETSQLFPESTLCSGSCLWGEPPQPEEEDRDLERTLNSHSSTLLDVYPSMLNQIGEAYRRQHVTNVASTVLRRYHRRRWQSSQVQHHNHGFANSYNRTLTRTRESSISVPNPPCENITHHQESMFRYQESSPHKNKLDFSPLKSSSNTSLVSTACFYSPRGDDVEERIGVGNESCWTDRSPRRPIRVLDISTPPSSVSSSSRSPSPDLNQTYVVVEPVRSPRSHGLPGSPVFGTTWSPLKIARMSSLASQGGSAVNSSPPSYRSVLPRDHVKSPVASPQRALSQLWSPLKAKIISLEQTQQTSSSRLKQALPVIHTPEVYRSPYKGPRDSPPHHQENSLAIRKILRHPSFSSHHSPSSSISQMPSRQLDADFTSLYHHFICRGTNPSSSCRLCKRQSGVQSPAVSSMSVCALSLTPVRSQLKKRHREPEVVESLRFKRFRESCSPRRDTHIWTKQQLPRQQGNRYMNTVMAEPGEDKYTWNRALLLQCPSPGFLRAIRRRQTDTPGSHGKGPGYRLDLQTRPYSQLSRRQLLYGPVQ